MPNTRSLRSFVREGGRLESSIVSLKCALLEIHPLHLKNPSVPLWHPLRSSTQGSISRSSARFYGQNQLPGGFGPCLALMPETGAPRGTRSPGIEPSRDLLAVRQELRPSSHRANSLTPLSNHLVLARMRFS